MNDTIIDVPFWVHGVWYHFCREEKEIRTAFYSKHPLKNLKYCIQRIKRGCCDADLWEIDSWFLRPQEYKNVTVYTACHLARHNEGCWKEAIIKTEEVGFAAHRKKDIAMAGNGNFGIMI